MSVVHTAGRPIDPGLMHDPVWTDTELLSILLAIIVLAAIGTAILFGVGVLTYSRRPTTRYLLITVALGLLLVRSIVGLGTVLGLVPMPAHHLIEHSFDFLIALLILYAVYRSGPDYDGHTPQNRA